MVFRMGHVDLRTFAFRTRLVRRCEGEVAKVGRCDGETRRYEGESAKLRRRRSDTAIAPSALQLPSENLNKLLTLYGNCCQSNIIKVFSFRYWPNFQLLFLSKAIQHEERRDFIHRFYLFCIQHPTFAQGFVSKILL